MRRMSGVDAAFLYGETPAWHMHVSAVLLVDPTETPGGFDVARFTERIARRLYLAPQFRWKLVEVPLGIDLPGWVEDPDFDIRNHIRHIGVTAPGGPEQLGELIGDLVAYKLDRDIPLWEMWVIDGLADGRVAILAKVHHSIMDGVSGSELATLLFDVEPDPPDADDGDVQSRVMTPVPSSVELLVRGMGRLVLSPWRVARFADQTVRQGLKFIGFQRRERPPSMPFQAPRTSFNATLSRYRRFAFTRVPLDDMREIKDAFGVKLNDVVLAVCAGALRRYLDLGGELPDAPLIAQVPMSLRAEGDASSVGTKVGALFASLATDIDDPAERLAAIHESTQSAKEMQNALAADKIMGLTEVTAPGLIALAARMYTLAGLDGRTPPVMNLIISNVPGPPIPLYVAGARVEGVFPMGPLLYGTGVNVTVFSYTGSVDFGFMVCRELVPEPWTIAEGISLAVEELLEAARTHRDDGQSRASDDWRWTRRSPQAAPAPATATPLREPSNDS